MKLKASKSEKSAQFKGIFALKTHLFYCPCTANNCEWKNDVNEYEWMMYGAAKLQKKKLIIKTNAIFAQKYK